jgi:hypothetical protein
MELASALRDVRKVLGRSIAIKLLVLRASQKHVKHEDGTIDPQAVRYEDGTIDPQAVRKVLQSESSRHRNLRIFVTSEKLADNMFYVYFSELRTTLCSVHDWKLYEPPSLRSYLLYVGISSILHAKSGASSHLMTRGCVMDSCKVKSDIKRFLTTDIEGIFCEECRKKYGYLEHIVFPFWSTLKDWIRIDFERDCDAILKLSQFKRRAPFISAAISIGGYKVLRTIEVGNEQIIEIHPCADNFEYLAEQIPLDQNNIIEFLKRHEIQSRVWVELEGNKHEQG